MTETNCLAKTVTLRGVGDNGLLNCKSSRHFLPKHHNEQNLFRHKAVLLYVKIIATEDIKNSENFSI